jgi:hypothetical protein
MNINYSPNRRTYGGKIYPDPYPVEKLNRIERPTIKLQDDLVKRVDERESGFNRSRRGDYEPRLKKEYYRFVPKSPISRASAWMMRNMIPLGGRRCSIQRGTRSG